MTTLKLNTYGLQLRIIPSINRYKLSHEINGLLRTNQYSTNLNIPDCRDGPLMKHSHYLNRYTITVYSPTDTPQLAVGGSADINVYPRV